jgi:hypothetical protein
MRQKTNEEVKEYKSKIYGKQIVVALWRQLESEYGESLNLLFFIPIISSSAVLFILHFSYFLKISTACLILFFN